MEDKKELTEEDKKFKELSERAGRALSGKKMRVNAWKQRWGIIKKGI